MKPDKSKRKQSAPAPVPQGKTGDGRDNPFNHKTPVQLHPRERRQMARTLSRLDPVRNGAQVVQLLQDLPDKIFADNLLLGITYMALANDPCDLAWDLAAEAFISGLSLSGAERTVEWCWGLSQAQMRGQGDMFWQTSDSQTKAAVRENLQLATETPACPTEIWRALAKSYLLDADHAVDGASLALDVLSRASAARPSAEEIHLDLIDLHYAQSGSMDDVQKQARAGAVHLKKSVALPWHVAKLCLAMGDNQLALLYTEETLKNVTCDEDRWILTLLMGCLCYDNGSTEKALDLYKAIWLTSNAPTPLRLLARFAAARHYLAAGLELPRLLTHKDLVRAISSAVESDSNIVEDFPVSFKLTSSPNFRDPKVDFSGLADATFKGVLLTCDGDAVELCRWLSVILYHQTANQADQNERKAYEFLRRGLDEVTHPLMSGALVRHYRTLPLSTLKNEIVSVVKHQLDYALWMYDRYQTDKTRPTAVPMLYHIDPDDPDGADALDMVATGKRAQSAHLVVIGKLEEVGEPDKVKAVFLPFAKEFWLPALLKMAMYPEIEGLTDTLIEKTPEGTVGLDYFYFVRAYARHRLMKYSLAQQDYEKALSLEPENISALNNLATIEWEHGHLDQALAYIQRSLTLDPDQPDILEARERISDGISQPGGVDKPPTQASVLPSNRSNQGLQTRYRVVRADQERQCVRSVFASPQENVAYQAIASLFPSDMVLPNVALQTLFTYQDMDRLLFAEEFHFYLVSTVDICVASKDTGRPLFAVETDSDFHNSPEVMRKDEMKDHIFQVGGLPLIRVRLQHSDSPDVTRRELRKILQGAGVAVPS